MLTEDFFKQQLAKITEPYKRDKVLLAVSGGLDSMTMLHLFQFHSGSSFAVAHCNFQLRGKESDGDEIFLQNYCNKHGITLHCKKFDTLNWSKKLGKGIQETARTLRYQWFEELSAAHTYAYTATAHHAQDNMETILMNLIRGTGIKGLAGIPVKRDRIIRPLLAFKKEQLIAYAEEKQLAHREDASNKEDYYMRNFIRHRIVPLMEELNPEVTAHFTQLAESARFAERCITNQVELFFQKHCTVQGHNTHIPMASIKDTPTPFNFLFFILQPYGFNADQVHNMLLQEPGNSGKRFISALYQIVTNRDEFILSKKTRSNVLFHIDSIPGEIECNDYRISFCYSQTFQQESAGKTNTVLQLDAASLELSGLQLRSWEDGDLFRPLGMKGHKKLSDFFIDKKVSQPAKEKALILCQGEQILAVLPYQIDERYKVTANTLKILRIEIA
ncbi:MAG: tRNA lysidine(34) synthetase TilS [Bacteroidia bacterium]|jgi:tRNA(Ile)-lysidine synthase